eukprot:4382606-Heterocapsa_arctica.AAC.1
MDARPFLRAGGPEGRDRARLLRLSGLRGRPQEGLRGHRAPPAALPHALHGLNGDGHVDAGRIWQSIRECVDRAPGAVHVRPAVLPVAVAEDAQGRRQGREGQEQGKGRRQGQGQGRRLAQQDRGRKVHLLPVQHRRKVMQREVRH